MHGVSGNRDPKGQQMLRGRAPRLSADFHSYLAASRESGDLLPRYIVWRKLILALGVALAAISRWRSLRRAELDLEAMDDRMLEDIGISRHEVGTVVRFGRSR
jgi:uncharacterized protein YjiS (DUF1127 family)